LAEQAYAVHVLPYEQGLSKMEDYDPHRLAPLGSPPHDVPGVRAE
jgi:hypothetical protein